MSTPDLIGTTEAAARCGVERSTFFRWMQLGQIEPKVRMPGATGAILFDATDVAALAEQKAPLLRHSACPECSTDRIVYWHDAAKCPVLLERGAA